MPVQTSKVYSDGTDDLSVSPNSAKNLKITSGLDTGNPGETPLTTNTVDGVVKRMDVSALTELTDATEDADLLLYQDTDDSKKIKAISANAFGGAAQPQFPDPLPSEGVWVDKDSVLAVKAGGSGSTAALQNSVEFAVVNNTFDQSDKNVVVTNRVQARWQDSKLISATHGQAISGILYAKSGSSFTQTFNLVVLKQPVAGWNLDDLVDQPPSTVIISNVSFPTGFNAPAAVTIDGGTLTNIEVSIHGAAFTNTPGNILPNQSIIVRGTTGAADATGYTALVSIGGIQRTWTVTTATPSTSVAQPTITSPADGAVDLGNNITVASSAYVPLNGAGSHASSDWELKKGGVVVSSSMNDTINKVSWEIPTGDLEESTDYTVRVRYRSSDPIESQYSVESSFKTGSFAVTWHTAPIPNADWRKAVYVPAWNRFVACGQSLSGGSQVMWMDADDASKTWTVVPVGSGYFRAIALAPDKNKLVAVLQDIAYTSTDGKVWDGPFNFPDSIVPLSMTYGGGRWIVVGKKGATGACFSSTDGENWDADFVRAGNIINEVVLCGDSGRVLAHGKQASNHYLTMTRDASVPYDGTLMSLNGTTQPSINNPAQSYGYANGDLREAFDDGDKFILPMNATTGGGYNAFITISKNYPPTVTGYDISGMTDSILQITKGSTTYLGCRDNSATSNTYSVFATTGGDLSTMQPILIGGSSPGNKFQTCASGGGLTIALNGHESVMVYGQD